MKALFIDWVFFFVHFCVSYKKRSLDNYKHNLLALSEGENFSSGQ